MTLVFNGDLKGNWGGTEYGGTQDGSPPLGDRLQEGATIDGISPPAGCPAVQKIICAPGDQYGGSTGWRNLSRQGEPIPLRSQGFDSNHTFAIWTPSGFPGDANIYIAPFEVHQTDPGGGTGVSPGGVLMTGSGLEWRVGGGNTPQSGGIGNPGGYRTLPSAQYGSGFWPITARNCWHVFTVRWLHGVKDQNVGGHLGGALGLWHAIAGVDSAMTQLLNIDNVTTMYSGLKDYLLFGIYRNNSGGSTTVIYTAGWREYSTTSEALARTAVMIGGSPPPVDTTPPSTPSGLTASVSGTTITLSWSASTDNVGVTGYDIERCSGPGCSGFTLLKTVTGTSTTDPSLANGTSYSYRIRAKDAANNLSGYSGVATAVTAAAPPPRPLPVGFLGGYHDLANTTPQGQNQDVERAIKIPITVSGIARRIGTYRVPGGSAGQSQAMSFAVLSGSNSDPANGAQPLARAVSEIVIHNGDPEGDYLVNLDAGFAVANGQYVWIVEATGPVSNLANTLKGAGQLVMRYRTGRPYNGPAGIGPWDTATDSAFSDVATLVWIEGDPDETIPPSPGAPVCTRIPVIQGEPRENEILVADKGDWTTTTGSIIYAYQWLRSGVSVAITSSYELGSADVGHTIGLTVTATSSDGVANASATNSAPVISATVPSGRIISARGGGVRIVNPGGRVAGQGGGG